MTSNKDLLTRIERLEAEVEFLKKERPGRKPLPILVSAEGVCGIDPERDSATCPDATIYRWQRGCQGTACEQKNRDYYSDYRKGKAGGGATTKAKGRTTVTPGKKAAGQQVGVTPLKRPRAASPEPPAPRRGAKATKATG